MTPKRQATFNCGNVDTKQPFDSLNPTKTHMPLKTKKEGETKLFQDIGSMENTFESFRIRAELGALECDLESSGNKKTCSKKPPFDFDIKISTAKAGNPIHPK